jgi:Lon protease-like protein
VLRQARYRVLFNTLLAGAEDVDEGLVDADSPFKGSRLFGMSFAPGNGIAVSLLLPSCYVFAPAESACFPPKVTGTALHIVEHSTMKDGRLLVGSKGGQRYRVIQVIKELPVLVCEVEWLKDDPDVMTPDDDFTLEELGVETRTLFLNTLRLSNKSKGGDDSEEPEGLAKQLEELNATELSFWMMNVFAEHPSEQQQMLDMTRARERLERARSVLRETLSYLSATSALKSALSDIEKKDTE